ncbi:MAG TPA: hypothetical protein PLI44_10205, partial [Chiayiivirga sp.]|nr:hypothetical protein [Chiayiivirga sp.]
MGFTRVFRASDHSLNTPGGVQAESHAGAIPVAVGARPSRYRALSNGTASVARSRERSRWSL